MSLFWLVALILFCVLEAITVGLTSIWFAVGAVAALIVSAVSPLIVLQVAVFLAVSFLTLLMVRPLAKKYLTSKIEPTNADRVIGREAVVTEDISNLRGQGTVSISGAVWTARSDGDEPIPAGTTVRVLRIEGVKVFVTPVPAASVPSA